MKVTLFLFFLFFACFYILIIRPWPLSFILPEQFAFSHIMLLCNWRPIYYIVLLGLMFSCTATDISDTNSSDGFESMKTYRMPATSSSAMAGILCLSFTPSSQIGASRCTCEQYLRLYIKTCYFVRL